MSNTRLYWLHALSPTHVGIGRGVDYIDLPIDRDRVTNWPIIRGSSFKGVWADHYGATPEARRSNPQLRAAFGIADDKGESNAGALVPSDARLVCLPVRSFRGTFAWATSPLCLQMLHRTLTLSGILQLPEVPGELSEREVHHVDEANGGTVLRQGQDSGVYLEDLDFTGGACATASKWATRIASWVFPDDGYKEWRTRFSKRFVVLPDDAFDFLCETGTEVHTRVQIDPKMKTVLDGHLWTEESIPAETILMGIVQCDRVFGRNGEDKTHPQLLDTFAKGSLTLQIGGKATVGRGQVRCIFTDGGGHQ